MLEQLTGKKIAILGFGQEGQACLSYLTRHGIKPTAILDLAPEPGAAIPAGVNYVGGESYLDALKDYDFIFRSPGMPRMHPKLLAYPNQAAIYSQTKLFFDLCPSMIVAVTGTKGKTTTANLMAQIFTAAGKKVWMGGNMGTPLLEFVDDIKPEDVTVLELSSFQTHDLHKSPHVGVILNVTQDHLDDGTEYVRAKANLIAHQGSDDVAVLHPALGAEFIGSGQGRKVILDPKSAAKYKRTILGEHNLENIAAASQAALAAGVTEDVIAQAVGSFAGVPQRLQKVAETGGISYYNDSASTNPDSTIAAIASFTQPIILILGGSEKNLDFAELGRKIVSAPNVKGLVVIGQVAKKILASAKGYSGQTAAGAKNMAEIVAQARAMAEPGDVILLSPGAASFGMFKNSKDRGNQFDAEVKRT
jgi:UDP-N-acetylmuramoylalanine--D-glutamate ligase